MGVVYLCMCRGVLCEVIRFVCICGSWGRFVVGCLCLVLMGCVV